MLQLQLAAASQSKVGDNVVDLLAAVKLTLLYVQNKLSSREAFGKEELEKLKLELLNLSRKRSSTSIGENHLKQQIVDLQEEVAELENKIKIDKKLLKTGFADLKYFLFFRSIILF